MNYQRTCDLDRLMDDVESHIAQIIRAHATEANLTLTKRELQISVNSETRKLVKRITMRFYGPSDGEQAVRDIIDRRK